MKRLLSYDLLDKLHETSQSIVYRAIDREINQSRIIKLLNREFPTPAEISRIKREYEILKSFDSPLISRPIAFCTDAEATFIVLEDTGGESLSKITAQLSMEEVLDLLLQVIEAIEHIHSHGIIHKDINPNNIIVKLSERRAQLIDFGIATELHQENSDAGEAHAEGTAAYMSPEQTGRMNRKIDYRSDYYSLGATFYEALTGRKPFEANSFLEYVQCHIAKRQKPACELNPKSPRNLSSFIDKLMEKTAEKRYQSSAGMRYDLTIIRQQIAEGTENEAEIELGQRDFSKQFAIPQKLYGREKEREAIINLFIQSTQTRSALVTISGYSGIGKSALIQEINKPIASSRGILIHGKFDQFTRNVPFSAIIQSLQSLAKQILRQPEERQFEIKEQLIGTLGPNMQVINDLVRDFELVVGKLAELPELAPEQARNRTMQSLLQFFRVIASAEHPLALFLDDMQWADHGTLNLLDYLFTNQDIVGLFVICAYRDNEVKAGHPFALTLDRLKRSTQIEQIVLQPLKIEDIEQIVADTLRQRPETIQDLAEHLYRKTDGNPFFVSELLTSYYKQNLIQQDDSAGCWQFDIKKIIDAPVADNVVEFLIEKLKTLDPESMQILEIASCLGAQFKFNDLSALANISPERIADIVWQPIREDLIVPLDQNYRLLNEVSNLSQNTDLDIGFKFRHDRVQQACAARISSALHQKLHYKIAKMLFERHRSDKEALEAKVIAIVRHFNEALGALKSPEDRLLVADLNHSAAQKARSSVAYESAYHFSCQALNLTDDLSWESERDLKYKILKELVQTSYLTGRFDEAELHSRQLLDRASTRIEKVEVMLLQAIQYNGIGKKIESVQKGIEALNVMGVKIAEKPSQISVLSEVLKAKANLGRRSVESIENSPISSDKELNIIMTLFNMLAPSTFQLNMPDLFALVVLKSVNISLKHGNFPGTGFAYVLYGLILMQVLGERKKGLSFAKLGLKIYQQFGDVEGYKGPVYTCYALLIGHWYHDHDLMADHFKTAIEASHQTGDLFWEACSLYLIGPTCMGRNLSLSDQIEETSKMLDANLETHVQDQIKVHQLFLQHLKVLAGLTPYESSFDDANFSEKDVFADFEATNFLTGKEMFHFMKAKIAFVLGDLKQAFQQSEQAIKYTDSILGLCYLHETRLLDFLACSEYLPYLDKHAKMKALARMSKSYKITSQWANFSPNNFAHAKLLMDLQYLRLGFARKNTANSIIEECVTACSQYNDFYAGIACELAAKYYRSNHLPILESHFLDKSFAYFRRWGANRKTDQMLKIYGNEHQFLKAQHSQNESHPSQTITTQTITRSTLNATHVVSTQGDQIDSDYWMQVLDQIHTDQQPDQIRERLLHSILQVSGAHRCCLIQFDEAQQLWRLDSSLMIDDQLILEDDYLKDSRTVPIRILEACNQSKQMILSNNISESGFDDQYLQQHAIKSYLVLPVEQLGKITSMIYIESKLATDLFTQGLGSKISTLTKQALLAMDNRRLKSHSQDLVNKQTAELRHIFQSLGLGVFVINEGGVIDSIYTEQLKEIMETDDIAGRKYTDFLLSNSSISRDARWQIDSILSSIGDDALTFHSNQHLLPDRMKRTFVSGKTKTFKISWSPIIKDDIFQKLIVILEEEHNKHASENSDIPPQAKSILLEIASLEGDKALDFFEHCQPLLAHAHELLATNLSSSNVKDAFRRIHTVKGHARHLGFTSIVASLQELERLMKRMIDGTDLPFAVIQPAMEQSRTVFEAYAKDFKVLQQFANKMQPTANPENWLQNLSRAFPEDRKQLAKYANYLGSVSLAAFISEQNAALGEIAARLGKEKPQLAYRGDEIEISKSDQRTFGDIFVHLIRNSIDHGIEPPNVRQEKGKKPQGTITISVERRSDMAVIRFSDDGAGLDLAAIYQTAMDRGIRPLPEKDDAPAIARLIFEAGFSTKRQLSEFSGMGIGMDSIRQQVNELGGSCEVIIEGYHDDLAKFSFELVLPLAPQLDLAS